ncbi:MAG: hypothetical protein HFJ80_03745, partial [Clostridiales bacterium]|nr:hypothetical protein [Clostridiales bacterium]
MKAVSTIFFTAGPVEVEPAGPQYAGVQGDHQATRVVFILDEALYAAQYSYRLEYVDGMGGYDTTDYLKPVAQEGQAGVQVEYWLPDTWTRSGGAGEIRLVVALLDSLNNEQQIVHTLTGRVYFSRREAGSHEVQSHLRHGLSSLIADAQKSAAQAQLKAEMASEAGERAQAAAIRAETAADSVNEVLSNATEAIDGAYAAGEAASKAAGQAERAADYAERAGVAANAAGAFAQNEAQNAGAATVLASQAASQASEAARSANSAAVVAENAADAANQAAGSITNKVSKDDITQLIPLHTMERSDDPTDSWKVSPELNIPNSGPVIGMTIRAVLAEEWDASVPMWCWGDLVPLEPAGIYPAGTYLLSLIYSGGRRSWRIQGADKADKTDVAPALTGTASGTALHLTDAAAGTRLRSLRFTGKLTETVEGEKGPDNPSTLTGVKPTAVQAGDSAFPLPLTAPLYSLPF